jgi:lipopolysaccharide export system permease protein
MRILRNYILAEMSQVFFSSLALMTLVLVCGTILMKMADLVINWGVDAFLLVELFVYSTPFLFHFTIPMSALLAVLLTFGKFSADHEITAVRASGISFWKMIQPVLVAATVLTLISFYINDRIASTSHFKVRQITAEIGMKTPASALEEGVFIKQFNDLVIFIHHVNGNHMEGIRIYQPRKNGPTRTIVADKGEILTDPDKNQMQLKLMHGTTDEPDANDPQKFYKLDFDVYYLPLDLSSYKFKDPSAKKSKEMTLSELRTEIRKLKDEHGIVANDLIAEVHRKNAMALSVIVFALIGIPLAVKTRRGEKSVGFAIAILLAALYWTLLMGATALAKTGKAPAALCLYTPDALYAAAAVVMIRRVVKA